MKHPYIIGITGGISCGKSTILEGFKKLSNSCPEFRFLFINADLLAHETYDSPEKKAYQLIVQSFSTSHQPSEPEEWPRVENLIRSEDNLIDRRVLGSLVFSHPKAMSRLEQIVWPETISLFLEKCKSASTTNQPLIVIFEAAILVQAKWDKNVNEVWTLETFNEEEQIKRIVERSSGRISTKDAQQRVEFQRPMLKQRLDAAHVVVNTTPYALSEMELKVIEPLFNNVLIPKAKRYFEC